MKVLVAGSDPVTRCLVELTVRSAGLEVVTCRTGGAARDLLLGPEPPQLAILDGALPNGEAAAVCRDIRARGDHPTCLVYLTAGGPHRARDAAVARAAGAHMTLDKPVDRDALLGVVTAAQATPVPAGDVGPSPAPTRVRGDLVGRTIDGKYRILELIGTGGMGAVYKARHVVLDELVAFKVIREVHADRPAIRARFVREAKSNLRLAHPGVIAVRDCGMTQEGLLYMTLDYSPGRSLRELIDDNLRIPEPIAVRLAVQIAEVLAAAHASGVIHRDLKPDNILVEEGAKVRVCDFGLAKLLDDLSPELTRPGMVVGTPLYMSPEQAAEEPVDGRSDIYALGCLLYEMLCGERVFSGATSSRVMERHLAEAPVPPSKRGGEVSPRLEALVLRMLAKDPLDRPQTARAVVEALEAIASGPSPRRGLRVLVADDSGVNRRLVAGMLERWGHRVTEARDGAEAVAFALQDGHGFDAIVLDGEMPRLDGYQAADRIRHQESGRRTPIVALTASSGHTERLRCLSVGMDEVLVKPVTPGELSIALERVTAPGATAEGVAAVFDRAAALSRCEGDDVLLRETLALFLEETRRIVHELRSGVRAKAPERVARAAHELKGAAANCAALTVATAAGHVEALARKGGERLEDEVAALIGEVDRAQPVIARAVWLVPSAP